MAIALSRNRFYRQRNRAVAVLKRNEQRRVRCSVQGLRFR